MRASLWPQEQPASEFSEAGVSRRNRCLKRPEWSWPAGVGTWRQDAGGTFGNSGRHRSDQLPIRPAVVYCKLVGGHEDNLAALPFDHRQARCILMGLPPAWPAGDQPIGIQSSRGAVDIGSAGHVGIAGACRIALGSGVPPVLDLRTMRSRSLR